MPKAGITHDITMESVGGTCQRGYMLIRDGRGSRQLLIQDRETLPQHISTGPLTQAEFPDAIEKIQFQSNWLKGIGGVEDPYLSTQSSTDTNLIADGCLIDSSTDGHIRLAQELRVSDIDSAPTTKRPTGFAVNDPQLWAFIGREPYLFDFTNHDWEKKTAPVAAAVLYQNGVNFGANVVAASWNETTYEPLKYIWKANSGCSWSVLGDGCTPNKFKFFTTVRNSSNAELFVGAYEPCAVNQIRTSTNPASHSAWSSAILIGSCESPITNLLTGPDNTLLIFKEDGVWTYGTAGAVTNITPCFEYAPHPDNFKAATLWKGRVVASMGNDGLMQLISGGCSSVYTMQDISLRNSLPEQTQYHNRIAALRADDQYLFALVDDCSNTKYYLMKGELMRDCTVAWHNVNVVDYTTSSKVEEAVMFYEGLTASCRTHDRMWIGAHSTSGQANPYYYALGSKDTLYGYTNCTGAFTTSKLTFGVPRVEKRLEGGDFQVKNFGTGGRSMTAYYRLDCATAWTTWFSANDNLSISREFPAGTTAKSLELKLELLNGCVGATSPELISFRLRSQLRPNAIQSFPMTVVLADNQTLLNGTVASKTKGDKSQLVTWDKQAAEVILRIPCEPSKSAIFLPGTLKQEEIRNDHARRSEWHVSFILGDVRDAALPHVKYGTTKYNQASYGET
tara:strand:+ start:16620 stop:18653 length:2034 start_codon:yes stop_codon:yes gene_type:complete